MCGITMLTIPIGYFRVLLGIYFGKLLNIHPVAPFVYAIVFVIVVCVDWIFFSLCGGVALMYTNGTLQSLVLMK